ncbi:MAG TPA: hypothetical protein VIP77_21395 [Jiangellaceae bacterium]
MLSPGLFFDLAASDLGTGQELPPYRTLDHHRQHHRIPLVQPFE